MTVSPGLSGNLMQLGKADSVSEEMHILEHCKALCYRRVGCAKDFSGVGMRSLI